MAELVPISQKFAAIKDILAKRQGDIAAAIPRGIDAQRFSRVALSNFQLKPQLLDCTPASVFTAIMQAAAWGLELDPVLGQAYLVAYKQQCQLLLGYRGMLALARRSGDIARFLPGVVHARDAFTYKRVGRRPDGTLGTVLDHAEYDGNEDPGEVVATYIVMFTKDGEEQIDVMFRRDIDKVRSRSRAGNAGPWVTDFDAMALKSVVKRAAKFWPLETSVAAAINQDELVDLGVETPIMVALPEHVDGPATEPAVTPVRTLDTLVAKNAVPAASASAEMSPEEHALRVAELKRQAAEIMQSKAMPVPTAAELTDADIDAEIARMDAAAAAAAAKVERPAQVATGQDGRTAEEQARERSKREQAERHEVPRAHRQAKPAAQPNLMDRDPGQEG